MDPVVKERTEGQLTQARYVQSPVLPYLEVYLPLMCIKFLLMPAYRSTDFEVHRNWLAVTRSLAVKSWYYDETSPWTLDYPPLFAWFEWLLSQVAALVDAQITDVNNLEYASWPTVAFQRLSVIVSDLVLMAAAFMYVRSSPDLRSRKLGTQLLTFFLVVGNAGLLIVDHIHFQYNGVLLGMLLGSLAAMSCGHFLLAGFLFALLLNMKHLFVYAAPIYLLFILRHYCTGKHALSRLLAMAGVVLGVCALSLGPFIAWDQLPQILSRLFPFGRGLTHAYWAPNFWSLYSAADKVLAALLPRLVPGWTIDKPVGHLAGGRVGVAHFLVLPQVPPLVALTSVLLALLPALAHLVLRRCPHSKGVTFINAVSYALLSGFMFGWHVHEKAVLTVVLPLALTAAVDLSSCRSLLVLAAAGHWGLAPLIFTLAEQPVVVLLITLYWVVAYQGLSYVHKPALTRARVCGPPSSGALLAPVVLVYLAGLVAVQLYCSVLHPLLRAPRLPFLPLMLNSVYCALGVSAVWMQMTVRCFTGTL